MQENQIANTEVQKDKKCKKKVAVKIIAGIVIAIVAIGAIFGIYTACVTFGTTTIVLDTDKKYQTMEGFGASSAWNYQDLGANTDEEFQMQAMEMLYGDSGLKLDTFRYNIGGGSKELNLSYSNNNNSTYTFFKQEVAEQILNGQADYSAFYDINNYDFTKDAGVLSLFEKALSLGNIDEVVFFANSPHYTMTVSGMTHGTTEHFNNLKEDAYEAFSQYMLIITDYLTKTYIEPVEEKFDMDIKVLISPVNEPQWSWGGQWASQEGCHYDPQPLAKFYQQFYTSLNAFNSQNNTDYEMDIFECGKYMMVASSANVNEYFNEFSKYPFFEDVTNISAHSYGADTSKFHRLLFSEYMDRYYPDLKVTISEYCVLEWDIDPSIDMGLFTGQVIMRDLTMLDAVSWQWWLSISKGGYGDTRGYEDGLIYWHCDENGNDIINAYKRYYVMGHFSKYIQDGSVRIGADYSDFLGINGVECVAFENVDGTITLVVINDSDQAHKVKIDGAYNNVKEVLTTQDENWKTTEYQYDGSVNIPAKSIVTYVFSK